MLLVIFDSLDLTDRVCLGLTCKRLAFQVTCAPRLPATYTFHDAPYPWICDAVNGASHRNRVWPLYISITPEWYTLLPRLAKGWVPKEKYKYCWKCNKIYPRERGFYENALTKENAPGWSWKLDRTEKDWIKMNWVERRDYLIDRWITDDETVRESLRPPHPDHKIYYPDLGIWVPCKPDARSIECPLCLERELTYSCRGSKNLFKGNLSSRIFIINLARLSIDIGIAALNTTSRWIRYPCR